MFRKSAIIIRDDFKRTSHGVEQTASIEGEQWPMPVICHEAYPAGTEGIAEYKTGPTYGLLFFTPKET